jgi:glycosyltransferase involved in cell wall biosynthesis
MFDILNGIGECFQDVVIVSNKEGVFEDEWSKLSFAVQKTSMFMFSRHVIFRKLDRLKSRCLSVLKTLLTVLDPLFFILNIIHLYIKLLFLKPSFALVCNGGYPASESCLAMVVAARIHGIKVVLSIVSTPPQRRLYLWPFDRVLDFLVPLCSNLIIVNSHTIKKALCESRSFSDHKIEVLHNGIPRVECHRHDDPDSDEIKIGLLARLDVTKGVLVLLDAFTQLAEEYKNVSLILAGKGDASVEIDKIIAERNLQHRVSALGYYLGNTEDFLNEIDIFAFPSFWEGFPYSIVEAMRSGCAIIATDVGGIPEAIKDGQNGLLVKPHSKKELLEGLKKLIDHSSMRIQFGKEARLRFEREFNLDAMHFRARALIESMI